MYFEAAILIALFGFVGLTALAKFLLRGEAYWYTLWFMNARPSFARIIKGADTPPCLS